MKHTLFKPPLIAATTALILLGSIIPGAAAEASPLSNTDAFLRSAFTNGQYVTGFTPGKPDFGFSLEALLQRKILGEANTTLEPAVKYLLTDAGNTGTTANQSGYLFSSGKLKLGLAGKWAFVSSILKAQNAVARRQIVSEALTKIDGSGDVAADAGANTYDRAWLVLGLAANDRTKQAALLATNLANHQLADGGFNDGFTLGSSSTDGTGISLQALSVGRRFGSAAQQKIIGAAIQRADTYLSKTRAGDHFTSYGDDDVNGTAYAAMGLASIGSRTSELQLWLKTKLASDGGFETPWSGGSGDIYATAQAAAALQGKSYAGLLSNLSLPKAGSR